MKKSQIANNELEKSEKSRLLMVEKNLSLLISVATKGTKPKDSTCLLIMYQIHEGSTISMMKVELLFTETLSNSFSFRKKLACSHF